MPRYYFLSDPQQTYTVGPFITVTDNPNKYFGQVIRSNEFSDELNTDPITFNLWSIDSELPTVLQVKYKVQQILKELNKYSNIKLVGRFEGIINPLNPILELNINDKKYVLEFKCTDGIIFCPSLLIE